MEKEKEICFNFFPERGNQECEAEEIGLELGSWHESLKSGDLFIKHHKWTPPKLRYVWASAELDKVFWGDPDTHKKHKGYVLSKDILEVTDGILKGKKLNEEQRYKCAFTLVCRDRTLELESPTLEAKELWKTNFLSLIAHSKGEPLEDMPQERKTCPMKELKEL